MIQGIADSLRRHFGKSPDPNQLLQETLDAFRNPDADALELIRRTIAFLRPRNGNDNGTTERQKALFEKLATDPELLAAFRQHIIHFIASRRLVTFFTDSGILPGTGFFSEWWRILWNRILPEVPDERRLKDCLHVIYDHADDWRWLEQMPAEYSQHFWTLLAPDTELRNSDWLSIQEQILDSVLLLAHRVSGLGVDSELMRASPSFDDNSPRFIALSAEALEFVNAFRLSLDSAEPSSDDGSQLLVMADQCQETLAQIRKRALSIGTSLHLSYILTRSEQSLERLRELVAILTLASRREKSAISTWSSFAHEAFLSENRRNSMRFYMRQLSRLMAVRVTENAARSGEHYICETKSDYSQMWRSAAGAGVLIAGMALLKIFAAGLNAPLLVEAFLFSMIYGLGFVTIYLLGLTVATKQPAMTAQTLASHFSDLKPNRAADLERLVDLVAAVFRSQLAAIAGNVMLAFPVAITLGWGISEWLGQPAINMGKGAHLLSDLDLLSWAIPHAAIAGFYLFLSGLITGYFDNQAAYSDLGARIARLPWLRSLTGKERAQRFGDYIQANMGGIMGNFLFGCMLGSTGFIGTIFGLPLDIRHIAFSSANIGYALVGFDFSLPLQAVLWAALGIAAIGFTNLAVSFALALRTALGARRVQFEHWGALLSAIWRRFLQQPRSFLLPPRE